MATMAMVMVMDMVTMVIITARGLLMPKLPLRLMLLPLPTMDTMATMAMVMVMDMVTMVIITARGLLMLRLSLMLLLLPTMDTMAMAMVMDTAMVMVMDTWVKLSNNLNKSSVFTALSTVKFICDLNINDLNNK